MSARINLVPASQRGISSEKFVFLLRKDLAAYLQAQHPGTEMRLLEDPPGPPTRSTFLLEVTSNEIPYSQLIEETNRLKTKLL
ncbi:MAG: hypothetical protein H6765_09185 [Candidatus Peribacteria bacterium]|nr:MAG: hypothetical protein H6765_09185 [Candidatus Peribacteria bacterium]